MTEHIPTREESEDHPYKSRCSCGSWFYLWENHMESIRVRCICCGGEVRAGRHVQWWRQVTCGQPVTLNPAVTTTNTAGQDSP